jgi:flagellar basal body-associated protein FliL
MQPKGVEQVETTDDAVRLPLPESTTVNGVPDGIDPNEDTEAQESTPLLRRPPSDTEQNTPSRTPKKSWWTIISIAVLLVITVNIIVFAFVIPSAAQSYATQATTYSLQNIEVQSYTDDGVIAKAQVNVTIDASRVPSKGIRNLGLFTTNIFKHVYTQPCLVAVLLPQYNGAQVALVALPALRFDIRNKHVNLLDIVSNVTITDNSLAIQLAGDFLAGRRQEIQTIGETDVHIKAGIIPLGRHHVRQQVIIQGR